MHFRSKIDPNVIRENSKIMAKHPGWKLTEDGSARMRWPHLWVLAMLGLMLVYLCFDRDQVVLNPDGFGKLHSMAYGIPIGLAVYALWLFFPIFKTSVSALAAGAIIVSVVCMIYFAGLVGMFVAVPRIATLIASNSMQIEVEVEGLKYKRRCWRRCLIKRMLGTADGGYALYIIGQPMIADPVFDRRYNFTVTGPHARLLDPEHAIIEGKGNWFGVRVEKITKIHKERN